MAPQRRIQMYTPDFASDPHGTYARMRVEFGALAPVELSPGVPATLVLGYDLARRILNDPDHFPADPREWERDIPPDCPVLAMMRHRRNALRSAGSAHERYRRPTKEAVEEVDLFTLRYMVEEVAITLINDFRTEGAVDLLDRYILPLVFTVLNTMLGVEPDIGARVAAGMAAMFESGEQAAAGERSLMDALQEQVDRKRAAGGDDITARLIAHFHELDDEEVVQQLVTFYGAGIEPMVQLIANALRIMLTDERFAGGVIGGSLVTRDALDVALFEDPPLANYCISYPPAPVLIDDVWLPAHRPVVIGIAAANNDPGVNSGNRDGNRSHLAFSIGPHACPARDAAYLIAETAIDQLLDMFPDIELAVPVSELEWRPGPFHRALTALPVTFPAAPVAFPVPDHRVRSR
ncbi:cytochrome P450 [Nocardia sp. NEAU-351]|uniref:Cytochrome P450 n=2 Tax=Nocardia bovistercoris TaxID=2785916 RepID=A0A931IAW5_9NOCA|nr:cytochrome P450 [Nocardia bovistercoris]MBH0778064.1 cytochrome P450 [Nocardia bovistercoris]